MGFTFLADRFVVTYLIGTPPGVGSPYLLIPPTGTAYKIIGGRFTFTTSAVAGNRIVRILFSTPPPLDWGGIVSSIVQPASLAYDYCFMAGFNGIGYLTGSIVTLPWGKDIWINPTVYLGIYPTGMDGGDSISGIRFTLEKTIDELA